MDASTAKQLDDIFDSRLSRNVECVTVAMTVDQVNQIR